MGRGKAKQGKAKQGTARRGEAGRSETHKPLAWDPMLMGLLTLVAPTFAQALMAKNQGEAKEQMVNWKTNVLHR